MLDPKLEAMLHLQALDAGRPAVPSTMLGLECVGQREILLAVGDARNESGYDANGCMTVCITAPDRQLGALLLTPKQVRQLRDYLSSKLEA